MPATTTTPPKASTGPKAPSTPQPKPVPAVETLIRHAIATSGTLDDHVVADLVTIGMTPADKSRLLEQTLLRLIPGVRAMTLHSAVRRIAPTAKPSGRSAHVLQVRNDWQRFLAQTLPDASGNRIRIADATVPDLRQAAARRRDQAEKLNTEARRWDHIADVLDASGLQHVRDLPPQRL